MSWQLILLSVCGPIFIFSGARIWIRKVAKFADPFLWGPLTVGLGCLVIRSVFGDAEIKGFAARVLGLFQVLIGLAMIALVAMSQLDARRYARIQAGRAAKAAEVDSAKSPRETYLAAEPAEAPPPSPAPASVFPPAALPMAASDDPPATPQTMPTEKEKPGTIERMPKGWLPEGLQRR